MQNLLDCDNILETYNKAVIEYININEKLTVDSLIDLSITLFNEIKVKGVDYSENESDMLLFQYGRYNWGDEKGEHANFDITRQFQLVDDDEFYQLSLSLIYDPSAMSEKDSYNSWSADFSMLEDWVTNIKGTLGYQRVKSVDYKSYKFNLLHT